MNPNDPGEGLLSRQGFPLVARGWQGDVSRPGMVGARFPVATAQGKPVTGPVATETIFDDTTTSRMTLPYPATTRDRTQARLTVRELTASPAQTIDPANWRFEDDRHIALTRPANM